MAAPFIVTFGQSCITPDQTCSVCFPISSIDTQCSGLPSFGLYIGLSPATNTYVVFVDKFGNTFWQYTQTDNSDTVNILSSSFPSNYFNCHAGEFEVFLTKHVSGPLAFIRTSFFADLANPTTPYDCIALTITAS